MVYIGCHLSSSKGFAAMGKTAKAIGADTFQFFTRNPRGSKAKELNVADVEALGTFLREEHFGPVVAHAPYTINPCSAEEKTREFALQTMADDLHRMEFLPGNYYNFHPGSHVGQGAETGIAQIAEALNQVLFPGQKTIVLLETMAGKGTEVGRTFQELREIIDRVEHPELMGVCLDTCHVHDGGYALAENLEEVLTEFDRILGLNRLKALHLNDSMNPMGAHKDRHEKIGKGFIGLDAMARVVTHPALQGLPMILETPNELPGYADEIALLRAMGQNGGC